VSYEDLAKLWKDQKRLDQEWELKLLRAPMSLRDSVNALLAPPEESWTELETKVPQRYVEVVDFYGREKPDRRSLQNQSIRPDGVLVFGIGITFDNGLNSYPKNDIYIPLAVKVTRDGPEFAFFKKDMDAPDQPWSRNVEEFSKKIIGRYKKYLSHDPHTGFGNKSRMGFL